MIQINDIFDSRQAGRLQTYFENLLHEMGSPTPMRLTVYRDAHLDILWVQVVALLGETSLMQRRAVNIHAIHAARDPYHYLCQAIYDCLVEVRVQVDAPDDTDDLIVIRQSRSE